MEVYGSNGAASGFWGVLRWDHRGMLGFFGSLVWYKPWRLEVQTHVR